MFRALDATQVSTIPRDHPIMEEALLPVEEEHVRFFKARPLQQGLQV